jgi:tetratricopeptide (TPR) repeat protein
MADNPRIEELRRRVEKDPASIAFAQLAEEYRRAGHLQESVDVCQAGLAIHPGYLSARVTLGRAFLELNQLEEAQAELEQVLKSATENLAAIRGLAEIHQRRGRLPEALAQYRAALSLARNDPDLEQTVNELTQKLAPKKGPQAVNGLSFDQIQQELSVNPQAQPPPPEPAVPAVPAAPFVLTLAAPTPETPLETLPEELLPAETPFVEPVVEEDPARSRALQTIHALQQWLDAIHDSSAERHA